MPIPFPMNNVLVMRTIKNTLKDFSNRSYDKVVLSHFITLIHYNECFNIAGYSSNKLILQGEALLTANLLLHP